LKFKTIRFNKIFYFRILFWVQIKNNNNNNNNNKNNNNNHNNNNYNNNNNNNKNTIYLIYKFRTKPPENTHHYKFWALNIKWMVHWIWRCRKKWFRRRIIMMRLMRVWVVRRKRIKGKKIYLIYLIGNPKSNSKRLIQS
jgi:hypothetical protein